MATSHAAKHEARNPREIVQGGQLNGPVVLGMILVQFLAAAHRFGTNDDDARECP